MKTRRRQKGRKSITSVLRDGFHHELFLDLHDHLYSRFRRPSLIVIARGKKEPKPCFPKKRDPLPDELYHHLTAATAKSRDRAIVEEHKMAHVADLISKRSPSAIWGWHTTPVGITDLYLPIQQPFQSKKLNHPLAVLIIGRFRSSGGHKRQALHEWIDSLHGRIGNITGPGGVTGNAYLGVLHDLADQVPTLETQTRKQIEYESKRSISLLERFMSKTSSAEMLFGEDGLIAQIGLDEPSPSITLEKMWSDVKSSMKRIADFLPITAAAAYTASDRDYTDMDLETFYSSNGEISPKIQLASFEEFSWLQGENWVNVPRKVHGHFAWLDPRELLKADHAILFGRAIVGGNLILLAFAFNETERLSPSQRTVLYDAVTSRIFPFIEAAMSAIELDDLMAETGHLLGRAVGKVDSGYSSLQEILPEEMVADSNSKEYRLAKWAVDDGLTRLNLIRQNFYSFAARRRNVQIANSKISTHKELPEHVDVIEVIDSMRNFFERSVRESSLKDMRYDIQLDSLFTKGNRDALKLTLLNLFDNALKFSYGNTFVTIRISSEESKGIIKIENLGIGVARDERRYVFKRLAKSRFRDPMRRIEGLGLGLSYCRRVIEDVFEGEIMIHSREAHAPRPRRFEGDNWLTTVTITLPVIAQESVPR